MAIGRRWASTQWQANASACEEQRYPGRHGERQRLRRHTERSSASSSAGGESARQRPKSPDKVFSNMCPGRAGEVVRAEVVAALPCVATGCGIQTSTRVSLHHGGPSYLLGALGRREPASAGPSGVVRNVPERRSERLRSECSVPVGNSVCGWPRTPTRGARRHRAAPSDAHGRSAAAAVKQVPDHCATHLRLELIHQP